MSNARNELLHAIFTTAIEGGVNYWSECRSYRWSVDGTGNESDLIGFQAMLRDSETGKEWLTVNRETISEGYRLASTTYKDRISWSSGDNPPLVITDDTDWDFDAMDADVIVQLGLFGDVIYG